MAIGESTPGRHAADADEMLAEGFCSASPAVIVDTGVLLAAADRADPDHLACANLVEGSRTPLRTSPLVIAETA